MSAEERKAYMKEYRAKNREALNAYARRYRNTDEYREKHRAYQRAWVERNHRKWCLYMSAYMYRRNNGEENN